MARRPGRPDDAQHERLGRLLSALAHRGSLGLPRKRLETAVGLAGASARRTLMRDIAKLRESGWDIRSVPRSGEHVYVLHIIDRRIRKNFTAPERAELLRAAQHAGLGQLYDDLDPRVSAKTPAAGDHTLAVVQHAIQMRCRLTFTYHGKVRDLHPYDVTRTPKGWMLRGQEEGDTTIKKFYLQRMIEPEPRRPRTAHDIPADLDPLSLDPMRWLEHDPITVQLACGPEEIDDVRFQIGRTDCRVTTTDEGAIIEVDVTNTDAFLSRLFEMGHRARLVGPAQMQEAARTRLAGIVEAFG
jgi:predicted DNA-binding transcriptional regulator YafY